MTDCVIASHPRCTNPSVTPLRAATAPLSGEPRAWAEVCGVCASVYHDADTYVSLTPVRGGVLDAPPLRDCRAASDAPVRPDRLYPRHLRCVRLPPTAQRIQSRGHSPRTILYGRPTSSVRPTPGGRRRPSSHRARKKDRSEDRSFSALKRARAFRAYLYTFANQFTNLLKLTGNWATSSASNSS